MKKNLLHAVVFTAAATLIATPSFAQQRQQTEPAPASDAGPLTPEEIRMHADRPSIMRTNALTPASDAVTSAADVSAGTFGGNTGGGSYAFTGNVGFGTTSPVNAIHLLNGAMIYETAEESTVAFGFSYRKARGTPAAKTPVLNGDNLGFFAFNGQAPAGAYAGAAIIRVQVDGTPSGATVPGRIIFGTPAERMRITSNGNVGIGVTNPLFKLHVGGDAHFTGNVTGSNIAATYQDVAEWVPATKDLQPGDVVVLNSEKNNEVTVASTPYDTRVAGVVSHQPGLTLGVPGAEKEMVATTGRVLVRVDATKAPVKVGDLLVTSDKPGFAMKSEPLDLQGRKIHQPGTIIGKALEPLAGGEGMILVLLSLQ